MQPTRSYREIYYSNTILSHLSPSHALSLWSFHQTSKAKNKSSTFIFSSQLSWTTLSSQTRLPRPRRLRSNPIKTNRRISLPRVRVFSRFSSSFKTRSSFPHSILFIWFFQLGFAYILLSLSLFERAREQVKRTVSYPHHHRL